MVVVHQKVNSLLFTNDKILDFSKLKAFADEKKCDSKMEILFGSAEDIVGVGKKIGYLHFLLFLTMFLKGFFFLMVAKSLDFVLQQFADRKSNTHEMTGINPLLNRYSF